MAIAYKSPFKNLLKMQILTSSLYHVFLIFLDIRQEMVIHTIDISLERQAKSVVDKLGTAKELFGAGSKQVLDMGCSSRTITASEAYNLNSCIRMELLATERKDDNFGFFIQTIQES